MQSLNVSASGNHRAAKPKGLTDWTEFCMVLAYSFHGVQFHVDALSGTKLGQDDIRIRRRRGTPSKDVFLFAGRYPCEVFREQFMIDVQFVGVRRVFWCVRITLAGDVYSEDKGVPVGWWVLWARF